MQMKINNDMYEVITSQDITNIEKAVDKSALTMPLVAVYCGSRLGNDVIYEQAARELGQALADNGMGLVYGGASIGLMGAVADEVIQGGAEAVGRSQPGAAAGNARRAGTLAGAGDQPGACELARGIRGNGGGPAGARGARVARLSRLQTHGAGARALGGRLRRARAAVDRAGATDR